MSETPILSTQMKLTFALKLFTYFHPLSIGKYIPTIHHASYLLHHYRYRHSECLWLHFTY